MIARSPYRLERRAGLLFEGVGDMKVDVDAIHQQERGLASERRWYARLGALLWGSLVSCGRLSIGQLP